MKRMKRLASLMLAMVMVMLMALPAFAADQHEHNINITLNPNDASTHNYGAYQVFKGDLVAADPNDPDPGIMNGGPQYILSNIEWGDSITDSAALLETLKTTDFTVAEGTAKVFADCTDAQSVAEVLATFTSTDAGSSGNINTFASVVSGYLKKDPVASSGDVTAAAGAATITVPGSGYYMVMDSTVTGEKPGAYTRYLLQVVGDANMVVKSEVPSGDKQVYSVTVNGTEYTYDPTDANYAAIGAHASFEISSSVPNYTGYDYYYFVMNDTLDTGLALDYNLAENIDSFTVVMKGAAEDGTDLTLTRGTDYYVYTGTDAAPNTFRLAFADIMNYEIGTEIKVTYSATVTADIGNIGTSGNGNTWNLQYSNNPNEEYEGTQDTTKPGLPLDEDKTVLGKTPDEKTLTYVTSLDLVKYANAPEEGNELAGATFTLTGTSYQTVLKSVKYYEVDTEDSSKNIYYKLLDGTYTTTAPTGTTYVEVGIGNTETSTGYLKNEAGEYYVPTDKTEYNNKTIYKLISGTDSKYADVSVKYAEKTKEETTLVPVEISIQKTTGADGVIDFSGLGAGEYTLTETVTPAGYNTIEPVKFTIKFTAPEKVDTGAEGCTWILEVDEDSPNQTVNFTQQNGVFSTTVINQSGSLLPSTGGIGTTIFYVVGGILVLGAGILLVVKRRMSAR